MNWFMQYHFWKKSKCYYLIVHQVQDLPFLYNMLAWRVFFEVLHMIDQINCWFPFSFKLLDRFRTFHNIIVFIPFAFIISCYLCILNSFANVRLSARTNSFTNHANIVLNFIFDWKEEMNFSTIPSNIKLPFSICKITQLFNKIFHIFFIIFWER